MSTDRWGIFDDKSRYLDQFGLLLTLTVASVVLLSYADLSNADSGRSRQVAALVATTLTAVALLIALRAAGVRRRWVRAVDVIVVLGVLCSALILTLTNGTSSAEASVHVPPLFALVLAVLAPIVVIRRLLTHRRVRRATLLGAVSVYLLIAVAFFYAFLSVDVIQSGEFFAQAEPSSDLMYFSLSTITTVGYGDLVAVAQPGRLLANTEAVVGQLYLVTFVGLLIGILTTQQNRSDAGSDAGTDAGSGDEEHES